MAKMGISTQIGGFPFSLGSCIHICARLACPSITYFASDPTNMCVILLAIFANISMHSKSDQMAKKTTI